MDIKKGSFFTVVRWTDSNDGSYVGECLEAIVIDGDLARVDSHHNETSRRRFTLNLSDVEVRGLSKEFVDSVICAQ